MTAEQAIDEDHPNVAIEALANLDLASGSYARALYVRAAQAAERHDLLIGILGHPDSADELVALVRALDAASGPHAALSALHNHQRRVSLSPFVANELEAQLDFRRTLSKGQPS